MSFIIQEANELQPSNFSTPWLSSIIISQDLKSDHDRFDVSLSQNPEYWQYNRSLAASPFDLSDSESDSDCDDDDAHSVASLNFSTIVEWEGIETLEITESNALGLVFTSAEDVLGAKRAESLRIPHYYRDDRNCDCPDQKPQNIGLQGNVSDYPGYKTFQSMDWPNDCKFSRAPRLCTNSLPEEDDEDLLYSGSDLGGWLTGALDGVPKIMPLDCLNFGLPVPFAMMEN